MKMSFLLFLLLPVLAAVYVSWRLWHILPLAGVWKGGIVVLLWLWLGLMITNFFVIDKMPLELGTVAYTVGNSWLFVLLYLFLAFLMLDLGRVVRLVPHSFLNASAVGTLSVFGIVAALLTFGNVRYHNKVRIPLVQTTSKKLSKPLRVVMMSDLHLGYHNRRAEFSRWVDMVNEEHPDVILIAGDVIDMSMKPLIEENMAAEFRRLEAPVYACIGNHEYITGNAKARDFYRRAGINLLRDSVAVCGDLCIIGRDDYSNRRRKPLSDLMKAADTAKYMILLDHQPWHLEQAEQAGIDFQFSGHTHEGQVFPANLIVKAIYEKPYGGHQRGNTNYYISSGIGIWGGCYRIGTRSEYVVMVLNQR